MFELANGSKENKKKAPYISKRIREMSHQVVKPTPRPEEIIIGSTYKDQVNWTETKEVWSSMPRSADEVRSKQLFVHVPKSFSTLYTDLKIRVYHQIST